MATPNPAGHQKYWVGGQPFSGVLLTTHDPGTQLYWNAGVPCSSLFGTVEESPFVKPIWPYRPNGSNFWWDSGRPVLPLPKNPIPSGLAYWVNGQPITDLYPSSAGTGLISASSNAEAISTLRIRLSSIASANASSSADAIGLRRITESIIALAEGSSLAEAVGIGRVVSVTVALATGSSEALAYLKDMGGLTGTIVASSEAYGVSNIFESTGTIVGSSVSIGILTSIGLAEVVGLIEGNSELQGILGQLVSSIGSITASSEGQFVGQRIRVVRIMYGYEYETPAEVYWIGNIRREPNISITDALNDTPNTFSFTTGDTKPPLASRLDLDLGTGVLASGTVLTTEQSFQEDPENILWHVSMTDHSWRLNKYRPYGDFVDVSATTVVKDLLVDFAEPAFTSTYVQEGLPSVTISFDRSQTFTECLSAIANLINAYFYVDKTKGVHFFTDELLDTPDDITDDSDNLLLDSPITVTEDISQIRTRVYVEGEATVTKAGPGPINTNTGPACTAASNQITDPERTLPLVPNVPVILPPGAPSITIGVEVDPINGGIINGLVKHMVRYRMTKTIGGLESEKSAFAYPSVHPWVAWSTNSNMPGNYAITMTTAVGDSAPMWFSNVDPYKVTLPCPIHFNFELVSNENRITGMKLWRQKKVITDSYPYAGSGQQYYGFLYKTLEIPLVVGTNVITETDVLDDDSLTTPMSEDHWHGLDSTGLQYRIHYYSNNNTTYKIYRSFTLDFGVTWSTDKELTTITVNNTTPYSTDGWTYYVDNTPVNVDDFNYGSSVTPSTAAIIADYNATTYNQDPDVTPYCAPATEPPPDEVTTIETKVPIFATCNDIPAQAAMAVREGGDGVHEYFIRDTSLDTYAKCVRRGNAELALFKDPIVTVNYSTRDPKTRSGKNITINLTNPPVSGTFKIQEVRTDMINVSDGLGPRYNVTASSVRFTLGDLLRRAQLR